MDFMKVFDQTVREIKREVNLKVLKVPEIEQKVLDATDDEPWGPHGTVMAEIAQATKKYSECQMVMSVLWSRLSETGRRWRYVYKSLAIIEYLVANGSERAVDDIVEHTFQISVFIYFSAAKFLIQFLSAVELIRFSSEILSHLYIYIYIYHLYVYTHTLVKALSSFEYVEPNGKDMGINVRKKVENIVALLNNKDKIQEVRTKAAATRDKYFGLSSTGITYKSGSASFGSSSFRSGDRYGGFGNTRDSDTTSVSYKDMDHFGEDKYEKSTSKPRRGVTSDNQGNSLKKGSSRHGSRGQGTSASSKPVTKISDSIKHASTPSKSSIVLSNNYEDDFDDFDPRGTSNSKSAVESSRQVDLFGQSLVGDLWDVPASVPKENPNVNSTSSDIDLFADASVVSAPSNAEAGASFEIQANVDLFASQPASSSAVSSTVDFFAPVTTKSVDLFASQPEDKSLESEQVTTKAVDPFSAVPLNSFDGSDLFGSFAPHTDLLREQPSQNLVEDASHHNLNERSQAEAKTSSKYTSQIKSGIWADSLSRGLIDLNISAPKKVNLADAGIVGGLAETDETSQAPPTSHYVGSAMGAGSGLGRSSTATDVDDMFSNLSGQRYQFGGFQK